MLGEEGERKRGKMRLIDADELLKQYDKEHEGPPGRARELIENAQSQYIELTPELCEDTVLRASVEYICRKNTVSTNPYEHEYHEKFIKFMDDPEISDFGRWQHSNGFNTALVAVKCDLDKVPSAQSQYIELTPEEAASEIASRSTMSAYYWLDDMIRLKQMGYAICRKKEEMVK